MKQPALTTVISLVIFLTNCAGKKTAIQTPNINNSWELIELADFASEFISPKGAPVLKINLADSSYQGHSGCNSYRGTCFLSKGGIKLLPAMATKMYCEDEGLETAFFNALHEVSGYKIEDNNLKLLSKSDVIAVFKKNDAN